MIAKGPSKMEKEQITEIIEETICRTLQHLGVDTSDPIAMQRDFAHVRGWRESTEIIKRKGLMTVVSVLIAGALGMLWMWGQDEFNKFFR